MRPAIPQGFLNLLQKRLDLRIAPFQLSREQGDDPTLHAFLPIQQIPPSHLLELGVRTPRSKGPFEPFFDHVDEASLADMVAHVFTDA